jgi:hypothetical protein
MALGTTGPVLPTSGLGFIGAPTGSPNAPANPGTQGPMLGNFRAPATPSGSAPWMANGMNRMTGGNTDQFGMSQFGGMLSATPQQQQHGVMGVMPQGSQQGGIGQIMSQLHPQAQQALRGIPPQTLQHLHNAGLIHPGLMQHMYGQR